MAKDKDAPPIQDPHKPYIAPPIPYSSAKKLVGIPEGDQPQSPKLVRVGELILEDNKEGDEDLNEQLEGVDSIRTTSKKPDRDD
jgi:hypothetical protein